MYLENLVFDASEPATLGRFWEAAVDGERLTDDPGGFETRLAVEGGPTLDLCFQPVPDATSGPHRLQPALRAPDDRDDEVARLLGLGALPVDEAPGDGSGAPLADPEGSALLVVAGSAYVGTGPLASLSLESADPDRDAAFWSWLTGWTAPPEGSARALRHPSRRGPVLELVPEREPKRVPKNQRHLDLRLEADDDADQVAAAIAEHGGREVFHDWGDLPWRTYVDPSGNDFCVLRASTA